MKLHKHLLIALLFFLSLTGCLDEDETEFGKFPEIPVNFESINSAYDDYNSASPYHLYHQFTYLFSSNRKSFGEEFDVVSYIVEYYYDFEAKEVVFMAEEDLISSYKDILPQINSSTNELGPFTMYSRDYLYDYLFYASDSAGNLDIHYVEHNIYNDLWNGEAISKINTEYNEAYPCFKSDQSEFFFCSDKEGVYDIYKVELSGLSVFNWLQTEDLPTWINCKALNSSKNDKCPYINGNLIVFASDREGGYGGYDLYFSVLTVDGWTEPINFGSSVNTEYDEYRPISIYASDYLNDVMFFSSNRPGGLGGFDLYYIGIPKMII